jgi:spermidine synthase
MATFFSVFPHGLIWINDREGGSDMVLFGQVDPTPINVDEVVDRFDRADHARAAESLRDVGFTSTIDLMSSYAGRAADLADWLKGATINTDRDLRLQYLAGMGVNVFAQYQIQSELMQTRRIPDGLFVASPKTLAELHSAIESHRPDFDPNLGYYSQRSFQR